MALCVIPHYGTLWNVLERNYLFERNRNAKMPKIEGEENSLTFWHGTITGQTYYGWQPAERGLEHTLIL